MCSPDWSLRHLHNETPTIVCTFQVIFYVNHTIALTHWHAVKHNPMSLDTTDPVVFGRSSVTLHSAAELRVALAVFRQ